MKKEPRNKRAFDKKAFVFTLDVMLGISVVFVVLTIALFFISRGSAVTLGEHQLMRIGSDTVALLESYGYIATLDHTIIETKMNDIMPGHVEMLLTITGDFQEGNGTIEVGGELPQDRLLITGRRATLIDNNVVTLSYKVWSRQQ